MATNEDHIKYITRKENKTIKLFNEQMIHGRIFDETPFEKISDLDASFSDFEAKRKKEEIQTEDSSNV